MFLSYYPKISKLLVYQMVLTIFFKIYFIFFINLVNCLFNKQLKLQ